MSAVDHWKKQANEALDLLEDKLMQYPIVQQISTKTPLRVAHLALGMAVFLTLFVLYGFGGRLVASLVGFAWPLYQSFHSLKNKPAPGVVDEEDTQWLTYWVFYSTFTLVESATNALEVWIPLYHLVKIVFLLWAMLPQTQGALVVYKAVIEPLLARYEGDIDRTHHRVSSSMDVVDQDLAAAAREAIDSKKRELVDGAINSLISGNNRSGNANITPAAVAAAVAEGEALAEAEHTKSL